MKFSFIDTGLNERLEQEIARVAAPFPPLGILYLDTILKKHGIEASILDQPAKGFTTEEVVNWVSKRIQKYSDFQQLQAQERQLYRSVTK